MIPGAAVASARAPLAAGIVNAC